MGHIFKKNKGSSMLLAICIFLILTVLGINVLAASYSNVQNMKSKYETEQTMQYVNSIYEIIDTKIRAGEFVLDGYLTSGVENEKIIETNMVSISNGRSENIDTYIEFFRTGKEKELKAEIFLDYKNQRYCITSIYELQGGTDAVKTYKLKRCEGVTSSEVP